MGISENWTRENLAWAAGLFEGEGCISVKPQTCQLYLGMTDEDVVRKFHAVVGMGNVYGPSYSKQPNRKPSWKWAVGGARKTQALLAAFWCFLGSRRRAKAGEAIRACAARALHGSEKTKCHRGHEFTVENTYLAGGGGRHCRQCSKYRMHARWLRIKEKKKNGAHHVLDAPNGGN